MSDITQRIDAVTKIGEDPIKAGDIQPAPKSVKIEITTFYRLRRQLLLMPKVSVR